MRNGLRGAALALAGVCGLAIAAPALAQKTTTRSLSFDGRPRTFQVFTPPSQPSEPPPLVILLHGSGRVGSSLLDPWRRLAEKERIVLAAPDSVDRRGWNLAGDGPDFIRDIVEAVSATTDIDPRRVYLFGHSAGGHHALDLALLESEYFAAAAVHAGALTSQADMKISLAERKIPLGIWSGTEDRLVPIEAVRATAELLRSGGFPIAFNQMAGHTHDYYGKSRMINEAAWQMLKEHRLPGDPTFKHYDFPRRPPDR